MKKIHYITPILILLLSLLGTLYFYPAQSKTKQPVVHDYDYLIEVSDGDTDSSLNYTLYNQEHVMIGDSLNCKELDSIIIDDNL